MKPRRIQLKGITSNQDEQEYLFQKVLDFIPDPTFAVGTDGCIIIWNTAMEELTGIRTEDVLGKGNFEYTYRLYGERKPSIPDLILDQNLQGKDCIYPDKDTISVGADKSFYGETSCINIPGGQACFKIKASPLHGPDGKLIGAIATLKDITEIKTNTNISRDTRGRIISSLQKLLEEKTEETVEHAFRINTYATEIGKELGLNTEDLHELTLLAALHDIGKIAIPDTIILKSESLSPDEWEIMKKHSEIGYNMTRSIPELAHISKKILHHHEWWNGQGYPEGLSGEEIPLLSRIIAVVDAFDVMTSGRSYKKSFPQKKALQELINYSGTHFEPHLVDIFIKIKKLEDPSLKI